MPGKFVVKKGPTGKFRFTLLSTNGQVVASSEAYETKRAALSGVASVQKLAAGAKIVDTTVAVAAAAEAGGEAGRQEARCEEAGREEAGGQEACGEEARRPQDSQSRLNRGGAIDASASGQPIGRERSRLDGERVGALHALGSRPAASASRSSATISPTCRQISGTFPARWAERIVPGVVRAGSAAGIGSSGNTSIAARICPRGRSVEQRRPVDDRGARDEHDDRAGRHRVEAGARRSSRRSRS